MATKPHKSPNAFRTISEVADSMGIQQHVLRFWETKFSQISPMKRGGGRRYYRPEDVEIIEAIRKLLHEDGYTIKGAQKYLKEQGVKAVLEAYQEHAGNENDMSVAESDEDSVSNSYETQILNIAQKNKAEEQPELNQGDVDTLKIIRSRLDNIRQKLKDSIS